MSDRAHFYALFLCAPAAAFTGACSEQSRTQGPSASVEAAPTAKPAVQHDASTMLEASQPDATEITQSDASIDPPLEEGPRLHAKTRFVWIRPEPTTEYQWVGFLWSGGSVKLRRDKPVHGPGCNAWYAIEPRGYVCGDGKRVTLDAHDPVYQTLRTYGPRVDQPNLHQYAESHGAPLYASLPDPREQQRKEFDVQNHVRRVREARAGAEVPALAGVDLTPASRPGFELPAFLPSVHEHRSRLLPRSTVAYSASVDAHERTFLLTSDYRWFPKDRTTPFPQITFRGLRLGQDANLPLAFFRGMDRPRYTRASSGELIPAGSVWPRLAHVELTGERVNFDGDAYLGTKDGFFVKRGDAVVPEPLTETPWGAPVGEPDTTGKAPRGRGTWIEVSVWGGWLVAFEGTQPVYATLISPGSGGTPQKGRDPLETAATPTGRFPITGKFVMATMEAPKELVHSAVPWTQNFSGPYAIHAAYWHDDWGNRKSGGCINLSPIDAKWMFEFTEPRLPDGWFGVRWLPKLEPATLLIIHE